MELRQELDQLKQWQREDTPSIFTNMMLGATREEAEEWEREDAREAGQGEADKEEIGEREADERETSEKETGEGEPDKEEPGNGESVGMSELPIRGRSA